MRTETRCRCSNLRALGVLGLAVLNPGVSSLRCGRCCGLCQALEVGQGASPDALVKVVPVAEVVVLTRDADIVFDWKVVLSAVNNPVETMLPRSRTLSRLLRSNEPPAGFGEDRSPAAPTTVMKSGPMLIPCAPPTISCGIVMFLPFRFRKLPSISEKLQDCERSSFLPMVR